MTSILRSRKWRRSDEEDPFTSNINAFMGFGSGDYNPKFMEEMIKDADPWKFIERVRKMHATVRSDKERIRLQGEYYNNVHINSRMFGPSRKQMFVESVMGGMERRFEIIDSQVNQVSFEHTASDRNPDKCRSQRVKCNDATRVVLDFKSSSAEQTDFIHANRIKSPHLFNEFIITQTPLQNTVEDFWRMIWQEKPRFVFHLNSTNERHAYLPSYNESNELTYEKLRIQTSAAFHGDPKNLYTTLVILNGPDGEKHLMTHFEVDMNDSDDLETPLLLLRYARCSKTPTIVVDNLGISRAGVLVAIEFCMHFLFLGPDHKNVVEHAIKELRVHRPYCIETPMQYIFIYRAISHFAEKYNKKETAFKQEYDQWLKERRLRMNEKEYRKLSPIRDPDLLRGIRKGQRPTTSQETHARIGELPEKYESRSSEMPMPTSYPGGRRYDV
ncbi:hypothetical protein QR680_011143 [Steinernema hermaphroditum]|uniref:Tyrosine-protein phosphatase domain-containing protein n=1 Tax=Steinernema hermaphroditum TaxID=289476 RepID=A0AA39ISS2_9BILA|nr:hypothetical protein QR680_011143 [Steinernema hermaphroditum]